MKHKRHMNIQKIRGESINCRILFTSLKTNWFHMNISKGTFICTEKLFFLFLSSTEENDGHQ